MRIVCISDTHSLHDKMPPIPDGDVLVHAGDCTSSGSLPELDEFTRWLGSLPHAHKILIAGNHDFCFERFPEMSKAMCDGNGITYLQDELTTIDGLTFYGSPWSPEFRKMAFNATESEMELHREEIPESTNVLITHGPAFQIFDFVPDVLSHVGCYPLAKRIDELPKLRAHICGHIHEGYGFSVRERDGVKFANAATCTERYRPTNPAIIIDLPSLPAFREAAMRETSAKKRPTEESLLEGLNEKTSHAEELAQPMPNELDPEGTFESQEQMDEQAQINLIESLKNHINDRFDIANKYLSLLVVKCVQGGGVVPEDFKQKCAGHIPPTAFEQIEAAYSAMVSQKVTRF